MNFIEELVKKYEGSYSEETKKSSIYSSGKYTFHPQNGVLELDGTKISINLNAVGDASRTAEPYRIVLYLDRDYEITLHIYPKNWFKKLWHLLFPQKHQTLPDAIKKQFSFSGNQRIINALGSDSLFCENIDHEKTYIHLGKKFPKCIILTPAHGIDDLDQFEKFLQILKHIESAIKNNKINLENQ